MHKNNFLIFFFLFNFLSCSLPHSSLKNYDRKDWPHWSDLNNNCLNTRGEILRDRSISQVKLNKKGCKVISGIWNDYYYPEKLNHVKEIDIDHLVPLKHAHTHGASLWSREKKEIFANDPENLVVTHRKYNRAKGPKGIDEWLPVKKEYACKYVTDWIRLKKKYSLVVGPKEQMTINQLRGQCPSL
jgi:hypothetical protein